MTTHRKILASIAALTLASGMFIAAPAAARSDVNGTVCVVADPAGFDDAAFNSEVLAGAERASRRLQVGLVTADPGTEAGIANAIDGWAVSGECDLIIGVGFIVGTVMEPYLLDYPDQRFAGIDHVFLNPGNAASVLFESDQPAFMAGYVAAAASATGKVGTYGGLPFPSVTDFMNGYALGVDYFNAQTGNTVEVLGWDVATQSGLFSFDFTNPALGFSITEELFDQGADTVFPVAGATGNGTYDAAVERKASGDEVRVVYPDFDPFKMFDRDRAKVLLTSTIKNVDVATYRQIEALVDGSWASGLVFENLATGGVELAPFHRANNQVPGFVRPALRDIRAGIVNGTIPTLP
jgi:basic membrane protein A